MDVNFSLSVDISVWSAKNKVGIRKKKWKEEGGNY